MTNSPCQVMTTGSRQTSLSVCVWIAAASFTLLGVVNLDVRDVGSIGFFGDSWPLLMGLLLFATQTIGYMTRPHLEDLLVELKGQLAASAATLCCRKFTSPTRVAAGPLPVVQL